MHSLSKNKIKYIRSLQQKKYRDIEGKFIVEGEKMVQEVLENYTERVELLVSTEDFSISFSKEHYSASNKELQQCSSLRSPNKALAVVEKATIPPKEDGLTLVLDSLQDPGNLGAILRIADWYGVRQIVCSLETVDVYNPKVVQASMGTIFRVPVVYTELEDYLSETKQVVFGATLNGENLYQTDISTDAILLLGNESKGISEELLPFISNVVKIPANGAMESLNVSVACGILVSEFHRNQLM